MKTTPTPAHPLSTPRLPTEWARITPAHPRDGMTVWTKIHDADGERNVQKLRRQGRLWFADGMYVYYTPTHWSEA
jgi:hypothetical protein